MSEDRFEVNWPLFLAIGIGVIALFLSVFALGRALASPLDDGRLAEAAPVRGDSGDVGVELNEFAISPAELEAVTGATIGVTNVAAVTQNLSIVDTDVATRDVNGGSRSTSTWATSRREPTRGSARSRATRRRA